MGLIGGRTQTIWPNIAQLLAGRRHLHLLQTRPDQARGRTVGETEANSLAEPVIAIPVRPVTPDRQKINWPLEGGIAGSDLIGGIE